MDSFAGRAAMALEGLEWPPSPQGPLWSVAALLRALADTVQARFNPVRVQGEVSGFARAASGHCYFTLKDCLLYTSPSPRDS